MLYANNELEELSKAIDFELNQGISAIYNNIGYRSMDYNAFGPNQDFDQEDLMGKFRELSILMTAKKVLENATLSLRRKREEQSGK